MTLTVNTATGTGCGIVTVSEGPWLIDKALGYEKIAAFERGVVAAVAEIDYDLREWAARR